MRLFVRQRSQVRLTPPSRTPCRTAAEPAAPTEPFDPSAIWALRLDPLTKLLLLAYAAQADATGRVLQPDRQEVTARTGLLPASVRSLTLALLERGLLTMLVQDDTDADAWGFRVTLGEGRA